MKTNILVVDDNHGARKAILDGLEGLDYHFTEAADGAEALTLVNQSPPDLIIMDVEMPRMGGYEVCRILKSQKKFSFIPIILMTAREASKVEGLELGADEYLIKPINMMELQVRAKTMLRLKKAQDELLQAYAKLKETTEKLHILSIEDSLMGIFNRHYFQKRLQFEFDRCSRYDVALSCLMMDIDHFKYINDNFGHPFGDFVLRWVSKLFQGVIRKIDILARYGGEEIILLLPQTDIKEAKEVGERLRKSIEGHEFREGDTSHRCTVSIGIATWPYNNISNTEDLVKRADKAVYFSKQNGRNKVTHYNSLSDEEQKQITNS